LRRRWNFYAVEGDVARRPEPDRTRPNVNRVERDLLDVIFLALLLFQIKHFLFDFAFQTTYQVRHKGDYLHPAGITHAGSHALGSIPALLVLTQAPAVIAGFAVFEFLLHYHIDWTKAQIDRRLQPSHTSGLYWTIFGADQLAHQLTYLGMTYAVLAWF
jgi:hypothetical protein